MAARLHDVGACVFDAYGTLFDLASAAARCEALPREHAAHLTALWRDKQLQYTWLRGCQGRHAKEHQAGTEGAGNSGVHGEKQDGVWGSYVGQRGKISPQGRIRRAERDQE